MLKFSIPTISVRPLENENILSILITLAVEKPDKSSVVKLLQLANIEFIVVTLAVEKLDKLSVVKLLQPDNMKPIRVTLTVEKLDRSSVVKLLQNANMEPILVTEVKFGAIKLVTLTILLHPLNEFNIELHTTSPQFRISSNFSLSPPLLN